MIKRPNLSGARLMMSISTFIRMAVGLATFMVLARSLGPKDYGLMATVFAYASIASTLTDFGFGLQALRDIGADRNRAGAIIAECLRAKTTLVVLVTAVAVPLIATLNLPIDGRVAASLLFLSTIVNSYGDMVLIQWRGTGAFARETRMVIWTSGAHMVLIIAASLSGLSIVAISAVYLLSRLIYVTVAFRAVRPRNWIIGPLGETYGKLRAAAPFAADGALSLVSGQVDVVLISSRLGLEAVGVYQAGSRLSQGALALAIILASVHIPRLAATLRQDRSLALRQERWMQVECVAFGLGCFVLFVVAGPFFTAHVLGSAYQDADLLWPGFATFILARFIVAALGISLVVGNVIGARVIGQVAALVLSSALLFFLLPLFGVKAAPWFMACGTASSGLIYLVARLRHGLGGKPTQPGPSPVSLIDAIPADSRGR